MLLPITLPYAIALCLCMAATTDTVTSGNDVPKATMVNPSVACGIPNNVAIFVAESTNKFAPYTIDAIPNIAKQPKVKTERSCFLVKCRFSGSGSLS